MQPPHQGNRGKHCDFCTVNDSLNKGKLSPHMIESEATMAELIGAARAGLANQGTMEHSADLLAHLGVAAMKPHGKSDAADATVKDVRAHGRCLNRQIAWMLGPTHDRSASTPR